MNSIAQTNRSENQLSEKIQYFLRRYHVSRILRSANAYKTARCNHHPIHHRTPDERGSCQRPHSRRLHLPPCPLQES